MEQARFTYSPLGKAFEKQIKTIEDQGKKQVDALDTLKSKNQLTMEDVIPNDTLNSNEVKKELYKIKEIEKNVDREKLIYETSEYIYSFKHFQTIKTFVRDIYEGKITIEGADEYQTNLSVEIMNFRKNTKPRSQEKKQEKEILLENLYKFWKGREKVLDAFESKIFLTKPKGAGILNPDHSKLKILTHKQMLQRLPIALAQVKTGYNSKSLLNQIRQIVYSLYQSKQITKKKNTIASSSRYSKTIKMNAIFINNG